MPSLDPSDIVDNLGGADGVVDDVIIYTLTFSTDMDASTVNSSDFGNFGTCLLSIGPPVETAAGVFTIPVTPLTSGTLLFQVNAGAVILDSGGNPLDTTFAIIDDTLITVNGRGAYVPDNLNQLMKDKKANQYAFLQYYWNHPNRTSKITMTGSLTTVVDQREFTSPPDPATVTTVTIDAEQIVPLTRVYDTKVNSLNIYPRGAGEFAFKQYLPLPWQISSEFGSSITTTIGQQNITTHEFTGGKWVELSSVDTDVTGEISVLIFPFGGDPTSGGKGSGDNNKCGIAINTSHGNIDITRYPWDWPWISEAEAFAQYWSDWETAGNTANGGGYSATSSLEVFFPRTGAKSLNFSESRNSMYQPSR